MTFLNEDRVHDARFGWNVMEVDGRRVHAVGPDGSQHRSVETDLTMPELIQIAVRSKNVRDFLERIKARSEW